MLGLLPVIVLGLAFMAFCYYQLAMHPTKVLPKPVWAIVILVGNLLGGIIYLAVERLSEKDHGSGHEDGRSATSSARDGT
jgi:hypothetical protein